MNAQLLSEVAEAAKRDGVTLTWSMIRLAEKLEREHHVWLEAQHHHGDAESLVNDDMRLDNEALALVLMAVIKATPAGAI
jgi:hypothetical protein